ncbi:MAG: NotI family restriction endonuclease [Gammaproteobacteria bacterium]|nr:NotI family restriction endonuclease [Gammaproteobacteria bacterium]MDE0444462.1 NotI family restriction endonuclease [Gammaproteobacteria bacterium]
MNAVAELFGHPSDDRSVDWKSIVADQQCPFLGRKCYKVRKSDPQTSIGSCTVLHGRQRAPILICPARLLERRQVFTDCLHLLTAHEPGNELHVVPEVPVPGGSVDHFLLSARAREIKDFVGIELQTLDTTGTVWPERQRLLRRHGVADRNGMELSSKPFGMNWKHTAKTTLVQMLHKVETFEHLNKRLVLVLQDRLLEYMQRNFAFGHLRPAETGDAMHFHAYGVEVNAASSNRFSLRERLSTDAEGIAVGLGLRADPRVELSEIHDTLTSKIGPTTLFSPA